MIHLTPAARISVGLVLLTTTYVMFADLLGLLPNPYREALESRKKICESLAIYGSLTVQNDDVDVLRTTMEVFVQRNEDVFSAALRTIDGTVLAEAGDHGLHSRGTQDAPSTPAYVRVPIFKNHNRWGTLEVRFSPIYPEGFWGFWHRPIVKLILFIIVLGLVGYYFFMKKILQRLDPASVIPARVKSALDTLSEGVVVLDNQERIVLANAAFEGKVEKSNASLMGQKASDLNWTIPESSDQTPEFPGRQVIREGNPHRGVSLNFKPGRNGALTFMVNGTPILDGQNKIRGALATFDDVTQIEEHNDQLQKAMKMLETSRDEVNRKNRELWILATQDTLTQCLNRRAFFESFDKEFKRARRYGNDLCCIMTDIDHFKQVNDIHGHQVGDQVLQKVAEILRSALRENDLICRYGGEEFVILLPNSNSEGAMVAAERYRAIVESTTISGISVTASFGVSSLEFKAKNPEELVNQADKSLYAAKHSGRNRVVCWGDERVHVDHEDSKITEHPVALSNVA